jgi:hypothetical protein
MLKIMFNLSGIFTVAAVYGLGKASTRASRTSMTIIAGLVGGAHTFMQFALFPDFLQGVFLFFWLFIGLLIGAAALFWLPETDDETTAE